MYHVYICICTYTYTCTYIHTIQYVHTYTYIHTHTYIYTYVCKCDMFMYIYNSCTEMMFIFICMNNHGWLLSVHRISPLVQRQSQVAFPRPTEGLSFRARGDWMVSCAEDSTQTQNWATFLLRPGWWRGPRLAVGCCRGPSVRSQCTSAVAWNL